MFNHENFAFFNSTFHNAKIFFGITLAHCFVESIVTTSHIYEQIFSSFTAISFNFFIRYSVPLPFRSPLQSPIHYSISTSGLHKKFKSFFISKDFPSDPVNLTLYSMQGINKYSSIFSFSVLSTYLQTICGKIVSKNHDG